jgi:hypothetical protein
LIQPPRDDEHSIPLKKHKKEADEEIKGTQSNAGETKALFRGYRGQTNPLKRRKLELCELGNDPFKRWKYE